MNQKFNHSVCVSLFDKTDFGCKTTIITDDLLSLLCLVGFEFEAFKSIASMSYVIELMLLGYNPLVFFSYS